MTSTRILAAVIGLAIILPALIWGGPPAVAVIVAIAMTIGMDEFARMAFPDDHRVAFAWLAVAGLAFAASSVYAEPSQVAAISAVALLGSMVLSVFRPGEDLEQGAAKMSRYVLGLAWIGGLLPFLVRLRAQEHGVAWVIVALAISWLSDTGAYFAGRRFGKRKLAPRVSPKKTVEGMVGGLATAILGVQVFRWFLLPDLSAADAALLAGVGSVMSVLGDLAESLLKRAYGVKDSGWILPGHGGILDRIDSLLFVAPTVYAYMVFARGW